jgi:hypothetical protein
MIITRQKPFSTLIEVLGKSPVFLVGCSECATVCHTGGEEEILALKNTLKKQGIPVTGWVILDPACHLHHSKRLLRPYKKEIDEADHVLVFACGNGVQTVETLTHKAIAGNDTLFLGEITRATTFSRQCSLCGECVVDQFEGLCPLTKCPKAMLNGPCGGSSEGKCEVYPELDCVWVLILQKAKEHNTQDTLAVIQPPKDWSKSGEMRRVLDHEPKK